MIQFARFADSKCVDLRFAEAPGTDAPIVLVRTPTPASSDRPSDCSSAIYSTKAFIDPQTFQVLRLETTTQDLSVDLGIKRLFYVPMPSSRNNVMTTSIDYGPVELGGKSFWLTKSVTNDFKDKTKPVRDHFEAHYTNYHRFTSTSTILPGEAVAPESNPQP